MNTGPSAPALDGGGPPRRGAYGLEWRGLAPAAEDLVSGIPDGWPGWQLEHVTDAGRPRGDWTDQLDEATAVIAVAAGSAQIDRQSSTTTYRLPARPTAAELTHPLLAASAAVVAHWRRDLALHCSAFVDGGHVWAILGDREAGKSTAVASLLHAGVPIFCDDLLVLRNRTAMAGPRSLDLRRPTAEWLGVGTELGVTGARERWRIQLSQVPAELPLGGFVVLEWGPEIAMTRVPVAEQPALVLGASAVLAGQFDPLALLSTFSLPMWRFRRPRDLHALDEGTAVLLHALA